MLRFPKTGNDGSAESVDTDVEDPRLGGFENKVTGKGGRGDARVSGLQRAANETRPDGPTIIAMAKARRRRSRWFKFGIGLLLLGALAFYGVRRARQAAEPAYAYKTTPVRRGDLREVVTATGTLKGLDSVDVGAVISGRIANVYVDVNDEVKENQVLAEIDPTQLKSRVEQSRAQVRAADASVQQARATAAQAKAELARISDLEQKGLASKQQFETATADAERGAANVASADAQATLSRATLKDAETQLSYAAIRAPMAGIVLARLVEPGQTVASSLQAPVLFTVARDLKQLELRVEIDEADVGRVQRDQAATFTVDAWPNQTFSSRVLNVHNLPTAGQTVVTYQGVLTVDNEDLRLKPGMTATASIITSEKKQVLLVSNAALRFMPPAPASAPSAANPMLPFLGGMRGGRGMFGPGGRAPQRDGGANEQTVYVLEGGAPAPVNVEVGGTDGEWTELVGMSKQRRGRPGAGGGEHRRRQGNAGAPPTAGETAPVAGAAAAPAQANAEAAAPPTPKVEEGTPIVVDVEQPKASS
jgi:HlyD family secretion protein